MGKYILKRVLLLIPTVFLVLVIVFALLSIVPGSVVDVVYYRMVSVGSDVTIDEVEDLLGMNEPAAARFFSWLGNALRGDFGSSYFEFESVREILARELPASLELGILTILLSNLISIPLGVMCASRQDTIYDYTVRVISIILMAVPIFLLATLVLIYPAKWWGYAPTVTYARLLEDPVQNLKMFFIPALLGAVTQAGIQLRTVRTVVLDVMRQDYIRTARSKGLPERIIMYRHAFRNSMIPVLTTIGAGVAGIIGGSVIMENVFNIPGVGYQLIYSLNMRDYPVIMGCVLVFSLFAMIVTMLVDIAYKWADPRVRLD